MPLRAYSSSDWGYASIRRMAAMPQGLGSKGGKNIFLRKACAASFRHLQEWGCQLGAKARTWFQDPAFYTKGRPMKNLTPGCIASILNKAAVYTWLSKGSGSMSQTPSNPTFYSVMWLQRPQFRDGRFICPGALQLFTWEACITPLRDQALDSKDRSGGKLVLV